MAVICTCCAASVDWWVRLRSHQDQPICHDCLGGLISQRDGQRQLMAEGWLARGFEPIFTVSDVARAVTWFEKAGFDVSFHDGTYAFAHREPDLTIHLALAGDDRSPGAGALYIHCHDADQVADQFRQADIEVEGPVDFDYGKREGSVRDPDGNLIRFGSPLR